MSAGEILVVEDDVHMQRLIQYNLERAGFEIVVKGDAESAHEYLAACMPTAIVHDIMLPGMAGTESVRRIRELYSFGEVPIVMLSAKGQLADVQEALSQGATAYMSKPFDPEHLIERVCHVIAESRGFPDEKKP